MRPDDEVRLRHLTESAETATRFVQDRTRSDLDDDEMLRLALTKLVEMTRIGRSGDVPRHEASGADRE